MSWYKRITEAFENAPVLPVNENSRYVLISDCHRGIGNSNDNFAKNQNLYFAALNRYYKQGYTYLELGDGDELWENRSYKRIIDIHSDVFDLLEKFRAKNRLWMLYGNHDHCKKSCRYCRRHCKRRAVKGQHRQDSFLDDARFFSGLILKDEASGKEFYLTHGNQAEFFNSTLAPVSGFLVRYLWKPMESFGVLDPTSAARSYTRKDKTEKRLVEWAKREKTLLIAGHTHRPMTGSADSPYFNTGSCVHPWSITCIEIKNRRLTLVKWTLRTNADMTLYVAREKLAKPVSIDEL